jgi:hypothetical protein
MAVVTVPEELATLATRSSTWREDCWRDRAAVEFFAFSTRPDVIPAYPEPTEVGMRSGNWWRC